VSMKLLLSLLVFFFESLDDDLPHHERIFFTL